MRIDSLHLYLVAAAAFMFGVICGYAASPDVQCWGEPMAVEAIPAPPGWVPHGH